MEEPELDIELIERMRQPEPEFLRDVKLGEVRGIVFYPDERLAQVSEEVPPDFVGEQLDKLVADMVYTMYMTGGMGLSAIQVGVPLRVFVCDITVGSPPAQAKKLGNQLLVAVNPVIVYQDNVKTFRQVEGCLSFPGVHEVVERPYEGVLRARDRQGTLYTLRVGGTMGRIVQHELDHLDGKTFLDRMEPMAKANAMKGIARFHKGVEKGNIRVVGPGPKVTTSNPKPVTRKQARKKRKAKRR